MTAFNRARVLGSSVAALAALLCCVSVATAEEAESNETKIARAMSAAPDSISAEATIMDVDGTVLREGSNGWTCMPGVGLLPGDKHPMCNDATWMAWMKAAGEGTPFTTDVVGYSYMLQGDAMVNNNNPAATDPNDGGVWVQEGPHLMLLLPSSMLDGVNRDPSAGGPYVMWGETPLVHVMVPVGERSE
jgi:hypothetical protein